MRGAGGGAAAAAAAARKARRFMAAILRQRAGASPRRTGHERAIRADYAAASQGRAACRLFSYKAGPADGEDKPAPTA